MDAIADLVLRGAISEVVPELVRVKGSGRVAMGAGICSRLWGWRLC